MSKTLIVMSALAIAWTAPRASADPYRATDRVTPFTLEDQHGRAHTLDAGVALLLFNRDMDGGKLVKQALEEGGTELLSSGRAIYVADISGMPKLIAKMFALPSMRKRPYTIWLDPDGRTTARLPHSEGRATLIFLRDLEITRIRHASTTAEIAHELESLK